MPASAVLHERDEPMKQSKFSKERVDSNRRRPHSSLIHVTPREVAPTRQSPLITGQLYLAPDFPLECLLDGEAYAVAISPHDDTNEKQHPLA